VNSVLVVETVNYLIRRYEMNAKICFLPYYWRLKLSQEKKMFLAEETRDQ